MIKMLEHEPAIVAISIGAFYRTIIGTTALKSPAQNPWKNRTKNNTL